MNWYDVETYISDDELNYIFLNLDILIDLSGFTSMVIDLRFWREDVLKYKLDG